MTTIDQYAYCSPFKDIHPVEKLLFAIASMLLVLIFNSYLISFIAITAMFFLLVLGAKINYKFYLRLMLIPLAFIFIGCLAVAVNFSSFQQSFIFSVKIASLWVGVSPSSFVAASILFVKSLAAVSCLYFLALTTPMVQIIYILRKLRIPAVIADLMILVYNSIFVFISTAQDIYVAQISRCGYQGFQGRVRCLAILCSNLYLKCMQRSDEAYNALLSRGFMGELKVLEEEYKFKAKNLAGIVVFNGVLLFVYYLGR
ncbi:MAG: cobalt ECF transporter T component CbiQ [Bacillota bacterium]